MKRRIIIEEEFGLYRIRDTYGVEIVSGASLEGVFRRALEKQGEGHPPYDFAHMSAEVVEFVLGPKSEETEGPASA